VDDGDTVGVCVPGVGVRVVVTLATAVGLPAAVFVVVATGTEVAGTNAGGRVTNGGGGVGFGPTVSVGSG
jgi:hypothetical protein